MPNSYETWEKKLPHEVSIFPKFHKDWAKIVDFLLGHLDFKTALFIKLGLYLLQLNSGEIHGRFGVLVIDS